MDFRLDDARVELQRTVARFAQTRLPLDTIDAREGEPIDPATWQEPASLGLLALFLPEDAGGTGLDVVDGTVVFEQLGSHLVPGPVLWTVLAASLVDGAANGATRVGGLDASRIEEGRCAVVEHGADLDVLLVLHRDGITSHRASDLPPPTLLDPLTAVGRFRGLEGGERVGGPSEAALLRLVGRVLCAAMLANVASRALEVARAYALERHQLGVPIGSFEAVKHLLADRLVRRDLAQSATYAALAVDWDPGREDPVRAAAAAIDNASAAVQILGGMGFTWEVLPNHLLKRAWVLDRDFGAADEHARHLGRTLGVETDSTMAAVP